MTESHSKMDSAAAEASAEAAAKVIAEKLAEKPVSVVADAASRKAPMTKLAKSTRKLAAVTQDAEPAFAPAAVPVDAQQAAAVTMNTTNQSKDTSMENATNTATDFAAKAQETATDMQDRIKSAFDKGTEMTADVTAFHKGNFDAVVEAGKVLTAGMKDLGRTAVEDAREAAETVTNNVKAMAAVKSPTELFQLQGEIARRNLDTMVARTSKNAEIMMKLANDMFAPLSTRASVAMERLNHAA